MGTVSLDDDATVNIRVALIGRAGWQRNDRQVVENGGVDIAHFPVPEIRGSARRPLFRQFVAGYPEARLAWL